MASLINYPFRLNLLYDDDPDKEETLMLEFRLVYQGTLLASSNRKPRSEHKNSIRRYFHQQLERLWQLREPLKSRLDFAPHGKKWVDVVSGRFAMGNKKFLPIVIEHLSLSCVLDILVLDREEPHRVITRGDLDGRIKTLVDALRIPHVGECSDGEENPLYCLLEDDKLISEIRVVADLLLPPENQLVDRLPEEAGVGQNHVLAIVQANVKLTHARIGSMDYL